MTPEAIYLNLTPTEIRHYLEEAGLSLASPSWAGLLGSSVDGVLIGGQWIGPHAEHGCLTVDGRRHYSAAWL